MSFITGPRITIKESEFVVGFNTTAGEIMEIDGPFCIIQDTIWVARLIENSKNIELAETTFKDRD